MSEPWEKEMDDVAKMPRPWEDCMCKEVAGDYEHCVIHRPLQEKDI